MSETLYAPTMTFDLTPEQESRLQSVRDLITRAVAPHADAVDASAAFPIESLDALDVWNAGPIDAVVALEEMAAASGAAAARAALGAASGGGSPLAGLRGVAPVDAPTDRQRLGMAAVAVGIGRAAVEETVDALRAHGDRPSGDPQDPPHWMLADAATEIDAARLLVRAAAGDDLSGAPAALVFAGGAAVRAVDVAVRVLGADAFRPGARLERMGRDARAVLMMTGTEDAARVVAADRLLDGR